jgi:hypothetical protein
VLIAERERRRGLPDGERTVAASADGQRAGGE